MIRKKTISSKIGSKVNCPWCNSMCHRSCVHNSLGCTSCFTNITPGYYYHAISHIENIISQLDTHKNKHIILAGDFNVNLLNYETDIVSQDLINLTTRHGFTQVISRPTRITDYTATLIDHIYTNQIHNTKKFVTKMVFKIRSTWHPHFINFFRKTTTMGDQGRSERALEED